MFIILFWKKVYMSDILSFRPVSAGAGGPIFIWEETFYGRNSGGS